MSAGSSAAGGFELNIPSRLGPWTVRAILALPFLVGVAALRGVTVVLPMFHGSDEFVYHYPTILRFGRGLPFPDLGRYHDSTTPLFQLAMAYVGRVAGDQIWRLRVVEVLLSYLLALALYRLLRTRLGMGLIQAIALTLLVVLSPYVYAASFRLMTDNLALLFVVIALERLERFRECGEIGPFLLAALCAGLAVLTRQSAAFLFGVCGLYAVFASSGMPASPGPSTRVRMLALGALAVAALPALALFTNWHGLTPPGGRSSACGLCAGGAGMLHLAPVELALAVIGLYGALLFAPTIPWRDLGELHRLLPGAVVAAAACVALLLAAPVRPDLRTIGTPTTAGVLWKVAQHTPLLAGTSLLFWLLVPLGGVVLRWRLALAPRRWLVATFAGCFLLGSLVIRFAWQKYVDPYALLILILSAQPFELDVPSQLAGAAALAVGFVAYTLSFV